MSPPPADPSPNESHADTDDRLFHRLLRNDAALGREGGLITLAQLLREMLPAEYQGRPLPPHATRTPAGTETKILEMRERVRQGYSPCHPDDAPPDPIDVSKIITVDRNGAPLRNGVQVHGEP